MRLVVSLGVVALIAGLAAVATLFSFDHFTKVERSFAGQCTPVTGIAGPEDMQIDPARRVAFISSLDRRSDNARGGVYQFNLDDPLNGDSWRDMTNGEPAAFRPLGMHYYEDGDVRRLFVVNEASRGVEMFDVNGAGGLLHLETFTHPLMTSPNNVVAVGRRSFYVTNDLKAGRKTRLGVMQFLARAATGEVLFTNGAEWRVAASDLRFANGVAVSKDGKRIYVAETTGKALRIFDRNVETNELSPADKVKLRSAPDNVTVDADGALWIAALPKPLAGERHRKNPGHPVPSEIFRRGLDGAIQSVYRDDGLELSASTAASRLGRILLIGALYDDRFLMCELPERTT